MCPGQGAQKVGMGKDLAERFPAARDTFAAIDEALGTALSRLMWLGPEEELTLTHNAQPAILAHSAAVLAMAEACDEALQRAGVSADEIDLLIPHQANIRIIEATARHAGMPMNKVMVNVDRYGNTSSASIPLALDQAITEGRVKPGSVLLLVAFGAGFTWGSTVIRW